MSKPLLALLLLVCTATSQAASDVPNQIQSSVQACDACHSDQHNANSHTSSVAPVLNGMSDWYIEQQLANFQLGYRTGQGPDAERIQQAHSKEAISGDTLSLVADYYDELEHRFSDLTLSDTSNLNNGELLFEDKCANCHTSAFGRFLSDGPEITPLEAPYILQQLKAMQTEQRKFAEETKHHRKMVERLKDMSTQDLIDIVGYISKNAKSL
ncbi:c-type cytochrome [Litoribrevibacter euphylliae]|uniref:C-type cytochrome n=1 Tax=Litoribrevibacter euphylliae TaxID=1834034 RepID=A0ABV7HG65_9GAMM